MVLRRNEENARYLFSGPQTGNQAKMVTRVTVTSHLIPLLQFKKSPTVVTLINVALCGFQVASNVFGMEKEALVGDSKCSLGDFTRKLQKAP